MSEPFSTIGGIVDRLSEKLLEVIGPMNTPCWVYQGSTSDGYGYMRWNGYRWRVSRLSWHLHYGDIPDGLWVLHHCDNRACCHPEHLFLGNAQDNTNDMESKGRHNYAQIGDRHPNAKIKGSDIPLIRKLCEEGTNHSELARHYNVKPSAIDKIASYKTWRHIS